ncbi:PREDICTED: uncharacterized protein LOC109234117 [Nicotiana attenuata]|uniref:Uncharacterized protein n=1 Tax=Nicotiana attenuata TaxID=49451 RepID=A0A1J6INH3_NICAT|nr:PREDICTED: uncharacterized protein LOC109234117 [Nicotiana attenuata]OIS96696.1 hypothetical protein A4A49_05927 [Nicotiana attenuata]
MAVISPTLFIFLFLIFPSGKVAATNMAKAPTRVGEEGEVRKILPESHGKPQYQCLAQLGPCNQKYCNKDCCWRQCLNDYNGLHPVAYCEKIPGSAIRLCACYHDCFPR